MKIKVKNQKSTCETFSHVDFFISTNRESASFIVAEENVKLIDAEGTGQAFTGTLCTAALISLIRPESFSMALPTTITSAPALQLR